MTNEQRDIIRKLQMDLIRIDNGESFFFNISNYKNLGLIKERNEYYIDGWGDKEVLKTHYYLTPKAKQYIKVMV
jgi:hypothetical protein